MTKPKITMADFSDISSEKYREYHFKDFVLRIEEPTLLYVSANGHRVVNAAGKSFYIQNGWFYLTWEAKEGCDPFVF